MEYKKAQDKSSEKVTFEADQTDIEQDPFIAHRKDNSKEIQSVSIHNKETACLAEERCTVEYMVPIAYLAGKLHDAGKYSERFQEYITQNDNEKEKSKIQRGDVNHATAGGILIDELAPKSILSEMIQIAIYSHHGIYDAIDLTNGQSLIEKRQSKAYQNKEKIEYELVRQRFYHFINKEVLNVSCHTAQEALKELINDIKKFAEQDTTRIFGSRDFYFGMFERLLMSLLIDADRSNTADFMGGVTKERIQINGFTRQIWQECTAYFEDYISKKEISSNIDIYRREISESCLAAASSEQRLYRLTLPTGSGKTLSGLRFALHHAKKFEKQRIVYVAPFNSILEQNADEIRNAIGRPEYVLEHHCNVIQETQEDQERYDRLTENWSSPIVATTAVQFLNTLFSSKTGSIRRMHSLCDSIILFDEIQALPVKIISLFNLAVNYLTTFCNTTVVLCSATQPVFDKLPQNRLLPPKELVEDYMRYDGAFRRVAMVDQTEFQPGGLSVEALGAFVLEHFPDEQQMLVIVNTKSCARKLYNYLKMNKSPECALFHLSTNMCALHRRETLKEIDSLLLDKHNPKPVICISTQLIEAGVDLSFRCVIRSLAGLDNIIQAAGRCNRHRDQKSGNVYIVKMSREAENVSRLRDIRIAQEAMEEILRRYRENPESIGGDLLSDKAKEQYYLRYLQEQEGEVDFHVNIHGAPATLVDLLSGNDLARKQYRRNAGKGPKLFMKQAFKTAGDMFEVISEDGKVNVVVEYDTATAVLIAELQTPYIPYSRQKEILQKLQLVTVGISEQTKNTLGRAVTPICGGLVNKLTRDYYSKETGVSTEPVGMEFLNM